MNTKNKKIKIILSALLCAAIIAISIGIFAFTAAANDNTQDDGEQDKQTDQKEEEEWRHPRGWFKFKNAEPPELPEGFELPEDFEIPEGFEFRGGGFPEIFEGFEGFEGFEFPEDFELPERIENFIEDFDINSIFNFDLNECKDKILTIIKDKLGEKVASGKITQEKADELLALLEELADDFASDFSEFSDFLFGGGFKMPNFGGHTKHFKGFENNDPETTEDYEIQPQSLLFSM